MSQKLIDLLTYFSDLFYNINAYYYAEIWRPYQIYVLHIFTEELAIPA